MPGAKPFNWTADIEAEIFNRMIAGEAVSTICAPDRDDWLPSESLFYKRLTEDPAFMERYVRAREAQAHAEVEEIRRIADTATPEDVQVARLRIDARKWRAAKLAPKSYGDKIAVDHSGEMKLTGVEVQFVQPKSSNG